MDTNNTTQKLNFEQDVGDLTGRNLPLVLTSMQINDALPVPLYEQIAGVIRTAIISGDLVPGTRLPTTHEMANHLKVGRNTVVTAYSRLAAQGYLLTNRKRGTKVAEDFNASNLPEENRFQLTAKARLRIIQNNTNAQILQIGFNAKATLEEAKRESEFASDSNLNLGFPSPYPRNVLARLIGDEFRTGLDNRSDSQVVRFQGAVSKYVRNMRGVNCDVSQIIPVRDLKSAIDLTSRVMIDPGHWVYIEDPSSKLVRDGFRASGAQLLPIPTDGSGPDLSHITGPPPRLIFVSPSVSFGFGYQTSEPRRASIIDAAKNWGAIIFECDAFSDLSYRGQRIRAIQGMDSNAATVYFGDLGETLGPNIRAGYLVVPKVLVEPFTRLAKPGEVGASFVLGALATFVGTGEYAVHMKAMRAALLKRLEAFTASARLGISDVQVVEPSGGLAIAIVFRDMLDEYAVCREAAAREIKVSALSAFYQNDELSRQRGNPARIYSVP